MATVQTLTQMASPFFASPAGLIALASVIPLIIFYMVRPQPEEQIMPSMMFFMADEESGTVSQALDRLIRNLMLIFHILLIAGLAAAIAQPLMSGLDKPEKSVIVFDRSASMEDDLTDAKEFANSNLGQETTLITVDENINVVRESGSAGEVRGIISNIQTRDVNTDIRAGIETAGNYEGDVFIASDLSQTVNSANPKEVAENLQTDRSVKVMDANQDNKWGIVEVKPNRGNSTIEVENFMEEDSQITLTVNERTRQVEVDAGEVKPVSIATPPGKTTAKLEQDPVTGDNTAYISIPGEEELEVLFIADEENQFFREAVNAIPSTSYSYKKPPINSEISADIYVVGKTNRILRTTVEKLESQTRNGKSLVLFGQAGLDENGFTAQPAELGARRNVSVEIERPLRVNVGPTEIYKATNITGETLSSPPEAMIRTDYGKGTVLLYNIQDEDFRYDFLYPVFWKNVFRDMTNTPGVDEVNLRTGADITATEITDPNGETFEEAVTAYNSGFYETPGRTYAVNMESSKESGSEPASFESKSRLTGDAKQDVQHFAAVILALIVLLELFYLMWLGDL